MNNPNYLVQVNCLTYNHAPYIIDAMNGFCKQQTNFPFLSTIFDDNSTDGEQIVIRNYLDSNFIMNDNTIETRKETDDYVLIYTRHKTNKNCYFAVYFLKYNHYQLNKSRVPYLLPEWNDIKYIAICEGDDYWTAPYKLQKQVDYLESHPECGLVHTKHKKYIEKTGEFKPGWAEETDFEKNLIRNRICTLTTCFRKNLWKSYNKEDFHKYKWPMGDAPLWLYIMSLSETKLLNDETGVYRERLESASHSSNIEKNIAFLLGGYKMKNYFIKKYHKEEYQKYNAIFVIKELKRLSYLYNQNISFSFTSFFIKNRIWNLKLYLSTFPTRNSWLRAITIKLRR